MPKKEINDDALFSSFNESDSKSDVSEILKELFDKKKLLMISDLTRDEISLITRIYIISKIKKIPQWEHGVKYFIELVISKDRKSRDEIIRAVTGIHMNKFNMMKPNTRFGNNKWVM